MMPTGNSIPKFYTIKQDPRLYKEGILAIGFKMNESKQMTSPDKTNYKGNLADHAGHKTQFLHRLPNRIFH